VHNFKVRVVAMIRTVASRPVSDTQRASVFVIYVPTKFRTLRSHGSTVINMKLKSKENCLTTAAPFPNSKKIRLYMAYFSFVYDHTSFQDIR